MSCRQIQPEGSARAAQWLLAEYDATDIRRLADGIARCPDPADMHAQELFDGGRPDAVTAADYQDPDRRCL